MLRAGENEQVPVEPRAVRLSHNRVKHAALEHCQRLATPQQLNHRGAGPRVVELEGHAVARWLLQQCDTARELQVIEPLARLLRHQLRVGAQLVSLEDDGLNE